MDNRRGLPDKVISFNEAVRLVPTGATLALGGMTIYRRPVAFVHALLAADPRPADLTLLCFTAGYESDLLVGAGMVSAVRTCYFGLEVFGLAPMYSKAAQAGTITIIEETEASLSFGIRAHLAQVSFMPGYAWLGTDLLKLRPDVRVIDDPYNPGKRLTAFPAIDWDIAVIHALEADRSGNARLNGNLGVDIELSMGAKRVIVTTESLVERFNRQVDISGAVVDDVVLAPGGAKPTSCHPLYPVAGGDLLRYIDACNAGQFEGYIAGL
nr:CoA transferase subunit A [Anaerolineae bacterium]